MKTCETCRLSGPGNVHGYTNALACHLQPPFPIVRNQDWCSHWATKEGRHHSISPDGTILEYERDGCVVHWETKGKANKIGQEMWL
jgi:hypothetical protein